MRIETINLISPSRMMRFFFCFKPRTNKTSTRWNEIKKKDVLCCALPESDINGLILYLFYFSGVKCFREGKSE